MIDVKKIKNFRNLGAVVLSAGIIGTFCSCSKENNIKTESGSLISQHANNDISSVEYHSPENIKNRGELVVGIDYGGSFEFYKDENGNDVGLSVDLSKKIAKEIGEDVEVKFVEIGSDVGDITEGLLNKVEKGEVDIAMSMSYIRDSDGNKNLKNRVTLSKSYLDYDMIFGTKSEMIYLYTKNNEISKYTSKESLFDKKIAVVKNSIANNMIYGFASRAEIIYCEDINECIKKY